MRGSKAGFSDGYQRPLPQCVYKNQHNLIHQSLLEILDIIFSSAVIAPLVVGYWRGTWELLGNYILPDNLLVSAVISFWVGVVGHLFCTFTQHWMSRTFDPNKHRLTFFLTSRLYTFIYGIICVNHWRGAWISTDIFTGVTQFWIVFLVTASAVILLTIMKCSRNLGATPYALTTDQGEGYFDITTMFKTSGSREPGLYVLDCVFSVLIVGTLVVIVWRGLWVMLDLLLYPENKEFSAWGSLVIGYGIVAVTFLIQPIIRWACDKLKGFCRLAVADVFLFSSFLGTVNVWRGVWMLLDVYLIPENQVLSCWLTHGISFILLAILNCSNSVLVRGVYIDAEEPAGECVVFPIHYIRLFFQKERTRKHQKQALDALEKQDTDHLSLFNKEFIAHNNIKIIPQQTKNNNLNLMSNQQRIVIDDIKQHQETNVAIGKTNNNDQQTINSNGGNCDSGGSDENPT